MSPRAVSLLLAGLLCGLAAGTASARSSDRNKPMNIDADTQDCTLDDNGTCTFTGKVVITQGTMDIRAAKAVIYRSNGEASRGVLTGSPATLKQQMDDGSPMTARASTIDYDMRSEIVTLTGDVKLDQPRGTMTGQRVVYNTKSGQVNSGGEGGGRVKMTIQPRNQGPASGQGAKPADAKPAEAAPAGTDTPPPAPAPDQDGN